MRFNHSSLSSDMVKLKLGFFYVVSLSLSLSLYEGKIPKASFFSLFLRTIVNASLLFDSFSSEKSFLNFLRFRYDFRFISRVRFEGFFFGDLKVLL